MTNKDCVILLQNYVNLLKTNMAVKNSMQNQ